MEICNMLTITSPTNEAVKRVARLHTARERKEKQLFIVEGIRAIETVYKAGLTLTSLYTTKEMVEHAQTFVPETSSIILVTDPVIKKMSTTTTPSGLLGIFKIPKQPTMALTPGLVLAQISDPGNMGTLIRTAAACNIRSVVIVEGTDPWSPKVVQASAGTLALVTIFQWDWPTLLASKKSLKLYGLVVSGGNSITAIDSKNALIVVGNEARGIPSPWLADCDGLITLPMPGGTESLNAAVAGSIALYLTFGLARGIE